MRRRLEAAARAAWDGRGGPLARSLSLALLPAEVAYRTAVAARNAAFDRGLAPIRSAPVPVVSVGNLSVGGTGKTPVAAWMAARLRAEGHRPAIVARGYGEDEITLHRRWQPDVAVHADADRAAAATAAARGGADCVVLDDGFQHRSLARSLDVVLLSAEQTFPGPLLPRGRYREPPSSLGRADLAILTRRTAGQGAAEDLATSVSSVAPHLPVARIRLVPRAWRDLAGASAPAPEGDVLAVCAVAGPEAFRLLVAEAAGGRVEALPFPDHHSYGAADVDDIRRRAAGRPVAVTEKDAVKLEAFADVLRDVRVLTLAVEVERGEDLLRERLRQAMAS